MRRFQGIGVSEEPTVHIFRRSGFSATQMGDLQTRDEQLNLHSGKYDQLTTCWVKAIPLQAWTGPEGSRRLRLPDFKKVVWLSAIRTGLVYLLGYIPGIHFC